MQVSAKYYVLCEATANLRAIKIKIVIKISEEKNTRIMKTKLFDQTAHANRHTVQTQDQSLVEVLLIHVDKVVKSKILLTICEYFKQHTQPNNNYKKQQ